MRIAQLQLIAFGPFRGLELDLSAPGIHVVFGRNEAGKSTTLRAIAGLLYGIDVQTPDAHVHKPADLRVGGMLVGDDGTRLRVVRRKGNAKTLLDERGEAMDDAVLQRLLRGVSQNTFRNAFGLDLDSLHEGAEALLEGRGDVGGSLFDASVGGGGDTRRLLTQLDAEADGLYKPRATAPALNAALKAFADAQKAIKEKQSLPEAYAKQRDALDEAKKRRDVLGAKRSELTARKARLERARRRVPLERKRDQLVAVLATLGDVARHAARITSIHSRLGAYERAVTAHRDESADAQRLRDRVADAARHAGVPAGSAALRMDGKVEARIQRLLHERSTLSDRIEASRSDIAKSERELARQRDVIVAPHSGMPTATTALIRAAERARGLADTMARHASEKAKAARRRQDLATKAGALGLFEGTVEQLVALRLPAEGALDELATRIAALDRALARHGERAAELDAKAMEVEQQLAGASGDFAPPTQSDLKAARAARDDAWARLRDARGVVLDAKASAALDSAYEHAARDADVVADRMIHEADRVTRLASLRAQQSTNVQQRANAEAERRKAGEERAALDEEHRGLWADAAITPRGLVEMRAWLQKHAQIADVFTAVRELEVEVEDTTQKLASARAELAAALEANDDAALIELLDRASAKLEAIDAARRTADEAVRIVTRLESEIGDRKASLLRDEDAVVDVRTRLAELLGPLGVPDDASADEVTRALAALRDLFTEEDKRAGAEARAIAAGQEARGFDEEAARAAADLAPDLVGLPARDVVSELAVRASKASTAQTQLTEADLELVQLGHDTVADDIAILVAVPDAADLAVDEVDAQLSELDGEINREEHSLGGIENGLKQMGVDSGAAEASAIAQEALERVRTNVERFVRAKVGAVILAREIERYREENQGPMLTNASQLFARLTLGGFTGVRAGYNDKDKPTIKCVREGNVEVDVDGLSEGTRDQLYLSLRLASLLRYADVAEPMPLVLDDVLIQFDDERARAALQILAELATRMQVLFFTHHTRIVELARSAVPASSLTIHELASPPVITASAPAPPT